ncbi:MBL fold metallo-hydrolase [Glaciihabitans sp. dw_435]|uniref:MBL fold metallo-hydrolase n=1 Tax=Glaciihabitans sp. dw_435 TaxID=2720081 RepID=UPI001BD607D2|nr:MBL fold metallo-hydrolase [Glaciihabitans sp. dw_435]
MSGPLALTILGSSTPYPSADNPCSGYLVTSGSTRLWLEAGSGTIGPLQQHVRLDEIDAIWISHLHADHSADLLAAYYALLYSDIHRETPLPFYGPPGIADRLAGYHTNSGSRAPIESAFDVHEHVDGSDVRVGDLMLCTSAVDHGIPAFGVRISTGSASLTFSGDTAPCANLTELARGSDALLCESESAAAPVDAPQVHHTPEDAGTTARDAGAGRLIVTHVGRFLDPADALTRAATRYDGPIEYAAPGRTFTIGA